MMGNKEGILSSQTKEVRWLRMLAKGAATLLELVLDSPTVDASGLCGCQATN